MSEPYDYRASPPPQPGGPQGWNGTSRMPMQALGAPPPDMQTSDYQPYAYDRQPPGNRPGGSRPDRSRLLDYTLKGLGLLGVALVSGFIWFLVRNNPAQQPQAQTSGPSGPAGLYAFQPYRDPSTVTDCVANSTDKVRVYLEAHPCVSLRRSLFTASLHGQTVVTSVAVVRMPTDAEASALRDLSDGNDTGHIKDLVETGAVIPGGPQSLQSAGYHSMLRGTRVEIVMTEYVDGTQDTQTNLNAHDAALRAVSLDATKQGIGLAN